MEKWGWGGGSKDTNPDSENFQFKNIQIYIGLRHTIKEKKLTFYPKCKADPSKDWLDYTVSYFSRVSSFSKIAQHEIDLK